MKNLGINLLIGALAAVTVVEFSVLGFGVVMHAPVFDLAAYAQGTAPAVPVVTPVGSAKTVVVPWGDYISSTLTILQGLPIAETAFGWFMVALVKFGLPQNIADFIKTIISEQMLQKALDYGVNAVAGATKDKTLQIPVANDVIRTAAQYVVDEAPKWLQDWLGGAEGIKKRIAARINLPVESKIDTTSGALTVKPASA